MDLLAALGAVFAVPDGRIKRMAAAVERDARSDEGARADAHELRIDDSTVPVQHQVRAEADVGAVVHADRRLHPRLAVELRGVGRRVGQLGRQRAAVLEDAGRRSAAMPPRWCGRRRLTLARVRPADVGSDCGPR